MDVINRFISIVEKYPSLIAINADEGEIAYEGLCGQAEKFASYLTSISAKSALLVGSKSPAMYAAILGCLGSGCVYSFVSEDLPIEKFRAILLQFKPDIVLMNVHCRIAGDPALSGHRTYNFESILDEDRRRPLGSAGSEAYVVFTSGTTGRPKGVVIGRAALNQYVSQLEHSFRVEPGDRVSQHPELGFDLSVCDTFGALCFGGTLYPFVGENERLRPARKIRQSGITHWNSVPSVMNLIAVAGDMGPEKMGSVKVFHFCGEPLPTETVRSIFSCCPGAVVINAYGPSEATVSVTCVSMTKDSFEEQCKDSAPIARATGEENLILNRLKDDIAEVLIVGPQLADGYLADTALTDAKFPTLDIGGKIVRAYLSGDLVRIKEDFLYFVGRTDDQIKISGHRLELAEIRDAFATIGFPFSVSGIINGKLCSLIESQSAVDTDALRSKLLETLEPWAVPSVIRANTILPRNINGKIVWDPGVFAKQ